MAGVNEYWMEVHKKSDKRGGSSLFYDSCIFQQQWNEICRKLRTYVVFHKVSMQHVEYLTRLLLDGLLYQDFITAARCIMALSGNIRQVPELVWRVGTEILRNIEKNHCRKVQFFKYTFMLCHPYKEEILLDFGMYLIQENQEVIEAFELIKGKCASKPFDKNKLLKAYLGLFEYLTWKAKLIKGRKASLDQEYELNIDNQHAKQLSYHAKQARGFFKDLVETDGLWDIFLTREVELLVHYGEVAEARRILERYREKNPENPNAHRYLYHFLKSQNSPKSELKCVLERLFVVDPTSELVNEYKKLLEEDKKHKIDDPVSICKLLCILFNKLDHYSCHKCLDTWKALKRLLKSCYHRKPVKKDIDKAIQKCWEERADWWPQYHFQEKELNSTASISEAHWKVILVKAEAARWLLGEDNEYTKAVQNASEIMANKINADLHNSIEEGSSHNYSSSAEKELPLETSNISQRKRKHRVRKAEKKLKSEF